MKVIGTHVNADFDGFASMIALLKLHPGASLVFPGSKEEGLRRFLNETDMELPEVSTHDLQTVEHLILVDASRDDRLGELSEVLQRQPRPFVEVYDHHPPEQGNVVADRLHHELFGATTTIVVREMMKIDPPLTSLEASVILAGIYEDTAGFLSMGTKPEDFEAATYLMQKGAELQIVNRMLTHRLLPAQMEFFNAMVAHCETQNILGAPVTISSFSWPEYVGDAAFLVHRLMDLEPIDSFFALIQMDDRVYLIARSRMQDVDAGLVAVKLGGGGHPGAASAVLKGTTLIEAREKLLAALHQNVTPRQTASDLMKSNVITIEESKRIEDAAETMNRYRINALPVTKGDEVVGTISRQVVDGAIFHGLKDRVVQDFMETLVPIVAPDSSIPDILEKMIAARTRFLLVGDSPRHVQGIITRMDLMRHQFEFSRHPLSLRKGRQSEMLDAMMRKRLPQRILDLLIEGGKIAERMNCKLYLVGGVVRDLLLHRENMDVDLVVEGDGIGFAEEYAKQQGCEVASHHRFGTATIVCPDGFKVDVATARTESYHAPAALPQVLEGILRQDLYRRDFTINTLAIDLSPNCFGRLVDCFGGWDDLHQGIIRVLHSLSFIDDPTRTLRAIRFATRFNFEISKDTKRLIAGAVDSRVLDKLSGKRFWAELRNLLQEEHPIPAVRMLHHYRLMQFIDPGVSLDAAMLELLYRVESVLAWFRLNFPEEPAQAWLLYLMALVENLGREERTKVAQRFQITANYQEMLQRFKGQAKDIFVRMRPNVDPAMLYFSLHEFPLEVLLYSMARAGEEKVRQRIGTYVRDLRHVRLDINGDDLLKLGMNRGPEIKELLERILRARLNGKAPDRESQLRMAESDRAGVSHT